MSLHILKTPISREEIQKIKLKDTVYITGTIVTARDQAHRRALSYFREGKELPFKLEERALFHCGPVVKKNDGKWQVIAAGPTTSKRMDIFEEEFLKNSKTRVIIGKGGMGRKTTEAMAKYGAIYCAFTGGAAALGAKAIKDVKGVKWLDLGIPEAVWILEVKDFGPLIVAIDTHKNNLFIDIEKEVEMKKQKILAKLQG